jgi:hypothetical protein
MSPQGAYRPMLKNLVLSRPLVVLDLETTGKRVQSDRIVDISTLKLLPDGVSSPSATTAAGQWTTWPGPTPASWIGC